MSSESVIESPMESRSQINKPATTTPCEKNNCEMYVDHETNEYVTKEATVHYERCDGTLYAVEQEIITREPIKNLSDKNQNSNVRVNKIPCVIPGKSLFQQRRPSIATSLQHSQIKPNVCVKLPPGSPSLCLPVCRPKPCGPCPGSGPARNALLRFCNRSAFRPTSVRQLENGLCRVKMGIDALAQSLDDALTAVHNLTPDC